MTKTPLPLESGEEKFKQFLNANGLRKTPERLEILRAALRNPGHFDAEILHGEMERDGYHVSKATLYSTLSLLCEAGLVRKLLFDTHQARYEVAAGNHSHMVCMECGKISEFDLCPCESSLVKLKTTGFTPLYSSTCVYGLCRECSQLKDSQNSNS